MYIIKNAFRNIYRNKGKNILIGIITIVITLCTCIGLSINKASSNLVDTYTSKNPLAVSFSLDMKTLREADDSVKTNFQSLTIEDIQKYADSSLVKDYYYTLEANINGNNLNPIENNKKPTDMPDDNNENNTFKKKEIENIGDFRITAYSNFAYLDDFTNGSKSITSGQMIDKDTTDKVVVISESLAEENSLQLNDEIILSLPTDENVTFTYKIIGIYKENSSDDNSSFIQMNALNSSNQIYTNISSIEEILDKSGTNNDTTKLVKSDGLSAKFYLNNNDDLENFEKEAKEKGLSEYYQVTTNENEILLTLKPIENLKTFSVNFLIVILIIGLVVLSVINFLNIRDRKYEIGVLRAIGMSKMKVTIQLVLEGLFISLASIIIGISIGIFASQPVTNKMLESEIESLKEEQSQTEENFGKGGFEKPSENIPTGNHDNFNRGNSKNSNVGYVDNLNIKIDFITILELFAVGIIITILSSLIALVMINKYSPNKILQNRI